MNSWSDESSGGESDNDQFVGGAWRLYLWERIDFPARVEIEDCFILHFRCLLVDDVTRTVTWIVKTAVSNTAACELTAFEHEVEGTIEYTLSEQGRVARIQVIGHNFATEHNPATQTDPEASHSTAGIQTYTGDAALECRIVRTAMGPDLQCLDGAGRPRFFSGGRAHDKGVCRLNDVPELR